MTCLPSNSFFRQYSCVKNSLHQRFYDHRCGHQIDPGAAGLQAGDVYAAVGRLVETLNDRPPVMDAYTQKPIIPEKLSDTLNKVIFAQALSPRILI